MSVEKCYLIKSKNDFEPDYFEAMNDVKLIPLSPIKWVVITNRICSRFIRALQTSKQRQSEKRLQIYGHSNWNAFSVNNDISSIEHSPLLMPPPKIQS